ncbi:MAG: prolyl-tRNA synthetase associated domain-containing protein [Oligoflexia bacterium]|nr:prolyl-tRNA synthetase associated domain-containing protein [Oligoflexia bacterium]
MIFDVLNKNGIQYTRVDHPPVFTCEEAARVVPKLPGAETKNLFLRDGKGRRHFLLSVGSHKSVDLKALSKLLGVSGLSLASSERLAKYLGVTPGAVSLLALINDSSRQVELLVDEELWAAEAFLCHPLVNTSTLLIAKAGMGKFFELTNHSPMIINCPASSVSH